MRCQRRWWLLPSFALWRSCARYSPVNILVVDDDVNLCTGLSNYLEGHGYTVYSASDALQALDVLERQQIGLVITDYMMPHVDGIRFTEMLKADPRLQSIPVLLITASAEPDVMDKSLRKGVALTLSKPVDMGQLLNLVRFAE
jgi:two-component system chemotaxis response regulator CheY